MLKNLTVHGFKSIERQTIALGALNVLIGANGSGKSNLLGALLFFKASVLGNRDVLVKQLGGANRLLYHGKKTTKACFFACESDAFSYEQTLIPVAGDRLDVAKEGLAILGSDVEWSEGGSDIDNLEGQLRGEEEDRLKDAVAAEELSEEEADGRGSVFRRLKTDDYLMWLENFSAGELWEKNVLGGRRRINGLQSLPFDRLRANGLIQRFLA